MCHRHVPIVTDILVTCLYTTLVLSGVFRLLGTSADGITPGLDHCKLAERKMTEMVQLFVCANDFGMSSSPSVALKMYHASLLRWNSTGSTRTPTPTLGMRLSCNFINAYRVQYTCTRVHACIPNGHPRKENRACRTSRRGSSCVSGSWRR